MLTGNFDAYFNTDRNVYNALRTFARGHVSRFPIKFEGSGYAVRFYDSRFPAPIASLERDNGKYVLRSDLIRNDKYGGANHKYNTRATSNTKLLPAWFEAYVRPVPDEKICRQFVSVRNELSEKWRTEFANLVDTFNMAGWGGSADLLRKAFSDDFINHVMNGTAPYSHPELRKFMNGEFANTFLEHKRRQSITHPDKHIFINPDDTVVVNIDSTVATLLSINELQEESRSKIALMRLLENNTLLDGVGIKISPVSFWLY